MHKSIFDFWPHGDLEMRSIFHTSHCGSTLLISLLSSVCKSYSEPLWTHNLVRSGEHSLKLEYVDRDAIIKYPSGLCHLSHQLPGKKIFLYRPLGEHIVKIDEGLQRWYIDYYYEYMRTYCHPSLSEINPVSDLEKNAFMWLNRYYWVSSSSDFLHINAKKLFEDKVGTLGKVCKYLELPPIKDYSISKIDVKKAGLNHSTVDVNQQISGITAIHPVSSQHGLINEAVVESSERVRIARSWVQDKIKNYLDLPL